MANLKLNYGREDRAALKPIFAQISKARNKTTSLEGELIDLKNAIINKDKNTLLKYDTLETCTFYKFNLLKTFIENNFGEFEEKEASIFDADFDWENEDI